MKYPALKHQLTKITVNASYLKCHYETTFPCGCKMQAHLSIGLN
jgi:hypothetical protein